MNKKYRKGQLDNCLALINSTSSQQVFDNLQPYNMQKELFAEINYIFMHAFDDFVNGLSAINPGSQAMDYFLQYAYVLITNQKPIDLSVSNVKAVFNEEMFDILQNIYDNYATLTVRQQKNIEFIMDQYSNGGKIRAIPGEISEFRNGDRYSRWGRLEPLEGTQFGIELPMIKKNYAKIVCNNIDKIVCSGNIIFDVVEQPRQFAKAYGCDNNLPYTLDDCSKEMAVNLQCVKPDGEWTSITNM